MNAISRVERRGIGAWTVTGANANNHQQWQHSEAHFLCSSTSMINSPRMTFDYRACTKLCLNGKRSINEPAHYHLASPSQTSSYYNVLEDPEGSRRRRSACPQPTGASSCRLILIMTVNGRGQKQFYLHGCMICRYVTVSHCISQINRVRARFGLV